MASLTQWTWVWVNSGSWWWTGRSGMLWFMGLQSQTQLSDWTELKVTQSCLTLCDPMFYTVYGIVQDRILEWVAFPFSRGSSQPRNQIQVFHIAGDSLSAEPQGKPWNMGVGILSLLQQIFLTQVLNQGLLCCRQIFYQLSYQGSPVWYECNLVQPLWKTVWKFLKEIKIELPYDPAITLLGIYLEKMKTNLKDACTSILTAALFIIAKSWKQPKCPLTDEWIKMVLYIYIYIYIYIHMYLYMHTYIYIHMVEY